jgi:hypothetical protein
LQAIKCNDRETQCPIGFERHVAARKPS